MNIADWAYNILSSGALDNKLFVPDSINIEKPQYLKNCPTIPVRDKSFAFSDKKLKFPKVGTLHNIDRRRQAIHTFANHELMAIEIFAAFFLLFPFWEPELRPFCAQLVATLKDEQNHFELYRKRLQELDGDFGEFPVNDFFWHQLRLIKEPKHFFSVISLSFEAANLDFALYYKNVFYQIEDEQTADVLQTIHDDEIRHVALGRNYLQKNMQEGSLWDGYRNALPHSFSPARGKGIIFDKEGRIQAGLDDDFIEQSRDYTDSFVVVNRKQWKE